jgi:chromosome partitioning protein
MAKTLAICTHKGGTGKTVTALSLATGIADDGQRCLLVDLDPQAHSHSTIGIGLDVYEPSLKDFFERHPGLPLREVIQSAPENPNLDIVPSDLRLAWTAEGLSGRPKKEELLRRSLRDVEDHYDWIVIDTPPSLGVLTQNALTASDQVLIPAPAEARATNAIADLLELVQVLKGHGFESYRILLTRVDSRKSVTNQAVMKALEPWKDKILSTVIPQSEPLNQAQMASKDIFRFAPDSPGAVAYRELIKEIKTL